MVKTKKAVLCKICGKVLIKHYQKNRKYCRPCWAMYMRTKRNIEKKLVSQNKELEAYQNLDLLCKNNT